MENKETILKRLKAKTKSLRPGAKKAPKRKTTNRKGTAKDENSTSS